MIRSERLLWHLLILPPVLLIGGFLVVPVGRLLLQGWSAVMTVPEPLPPFVWPHLIGVTRNTFVLGGLTTAISLLIALPLAFVLGKTDIAGSRLWLALLTIPMISPPFIMAFSTLLLYGRSGFFSLILQSRFGLEMPHIFGLPGLVLTQLTVSIPYATFVLIAGLRGVPRHVEETAAAMGASPARIVRDLVIPTIFPHMIIAGLMVFLMSIGDIGGPLIIGGGYPVIASEIYNNVLSLLTDDRIAIILGSWIILLSFIMLTLVSVLLRFTVRQYRPGNDPVIYRLGTTRAIIFILLSLVVFWLFLPFLMVMVQSFGTIWTAEPIPRGWTLTHYHRVLASPRMILNTAGFALLVTPIMVVISVILGHAFQLRKSWRFLNAVMVLPFLLPGVVLALGVVESYAGLFSRSRAIPFYLLLLFTVMVRRLPYSLKTLEAGFLVTDRQQEEVATSLGSARFTAFRNVTLPRMRPYIVAAGVIGFIQVATELSASLILAPPDWQSLSMGIVYYIEQGQLGRASAMSVVLVAIIGTGTFAVMYRLHRPAPKNIHDDGMEALILGRTPLVIPRNRRQISLRTPAWGRWEPRLVVDSSYGIVDANRSFLKLVGAETLGQLRGETRFSALFFGDRMLLEIFSTGYAIQERASSIMAIDGRRVPVIVHAQVIDTNRESVRGYFYCRKVSGRTRRIREYRRLREGMATAEQEILKAQITPHMLFNTLNNVVQMIETEPREARIVVQSLADLYRYTLAATKKELVPISEEINAIRTYLTVEKARFGPRLTWSIDVDPATRNTWIPPMILQPVVENAVNHGADKTGQITLTISIATVGDETLLQVADRGCEPFDREIVVAGTGTGLKNVDGRLFALYRRKIQFEQRTGGGLAVTIAIPEREGKNR